MASGRGGALLIVALTSACDAPRIEVARADAESDPMRAQAAFEAEVFCDKYAACQPLLVATEGGDRAGCVRALSEMRYRLTFARGATATIPERRACFEKLAKTTCVEFMRTTRGELNANVCTFTGTLKDGDGCAWGGQCESGACAASCGVCVRRTTVERSKCPCGPGFICAYDACVRPRELGEDCAADECHVDLVCRSGKCAPAPNEGEPCVTDADHSCGQRWKDLSCDTTTNKCVKNEVAKNIGDACGFMPNGVIRLCPFGAGCRALDGGSIGQCAPRPREGEVCGPYPALSCVLPAGCAFYRCRTIDAADCDLPVTP